jgi:sulfofructose kinase
MVVLIPLEMKMAAQWDILGIGTAAVDDLLLVEHFPTPDSKVDVLESSRQGGGQTATAMVAAARQGVKTAFCCHLGNDLLSQFTIEALEKEGVDCSPCIRTDEGNPYHSIIIVDKTKLTRTILHHGGNVSPPVSIITDDLITRARFLFLDDNSHASGIKAARIAHAHEIPVIADIEPDPPPGYEEMLALVDHLVIGREFAAMLSGRDKEAEMVTYLSVGRICCVVTGGEDGCWYAQNGGPATHEPAFKVEVVDTTGCGDVFHGAFAAALARGQSIDKAVRVANGSAALKATKLGGRAGIPDLETLNRIITVK